MNLVHYQFKGELVNRSDLTEALSKDTGLTIVKAEEVVRTVFNSVANTLAHGAGVEKIRLPGDGSREQRQLRSLKGIPLSEYGAEGLKQLGAEYGVQWIY
jgi:nucleoid DNA-binding protein